jgi:uncharacterized membrane protein
MGFLKENRIILLCCLVGLSELFMFRDTMIPVITILLILSLLVIKVAGSEFSSRIERLINLTAGTLIFISMFILITGIL